MQYLPTFPTFSCLVPHSLSLFIEKPKDGFKKKIPGAHRSPSLYTALPSGALPGTGILGVSLRRATLSRMMIYPQALKVMVGYTSRICIQKMGQKNGPPHRMASGWRTLDRA
jgi:hypothetical protein